MLIRWINRPWRLCFQLYNSSVCHHICGGVTGEITRRWQGWSGHRYGFGRHLWNVPITWMPTALRVSPNPVWLEIELLMIGVRSCLPLSSSIRRWSRLSSWRSYFSSSGSCTQTRRRSFVCELVASAASSFTPSSSSDHSLYVPPCEGFGIPRCRVAVLT
jgi:hypothetical protein